MNIYNRRVGMEELTLYFSLKYEGDFQSIYNALLKKERVDEQLKHQLLKEIKCKYTTIFSCYLHIL